ncbi:predicted protein [Plenodomus lingam JN3]|uniref:Predicted protein n=1 Tax=Leptosphaeria maculans (strain JN3 / isolate v23.1.3 / race Av1-4-5-6-7-8) TaxID=985895 RepID=E5R4E1_LEPMJ|nr:predicted protein [Plenodomus lingam JN3]CBX91909.1 predicted protein [Plenodomus lingam JN3]
MCRTPVRKIDIVTVGGNLSGRGRGGLSLILALGNDDNLVIGPSIKS